MRKVLFVVAFVLGTFSLGLCGFGFQPGVNLGLNMANWSFSEDLGDSVDISMRMGINAGASLDININETVAIESGLYYTMKGCKRKNNYSGMEETEYTAAYDYLTIPIKIKAKFGPEKLRPFIAVGPEIGLLLSAKVKNDEDTDVKDDMESMDFGLYLGGGVEIPFSEKVFIVQVAYVLGLMDLYAEDTDNDSTVKNTGIYILTGIRFPL
ncbi:PorT family protein [bacterium]|nr:PorT family protein [bacterium]